MNGCDNIQTELCEYLDGELSVQDAQRVELHLKGCAACRAEAERLSEAIQAVKALPRRTAPASILLKVRTGMKESPAPQRSANVVQGGFSPFKQFVNKYALSAVALVMVGITLQWALKVSNQPSVDKVSRATESSATPEAPKQAAAKDSDNSLRAEKSAEVASSNALQDAAPADKPTEKRKALDADHSVNEKSNARSAGASGDLDGKYRGEAKPAAKDGIAEGGEKQAHAQTPRAVDALRNSLKKREEAEDRRFTESNIGAKGADKGRGAEQAENLTEASRTRATWAQKDEKMERAKAAPGKPAEFGGTVEAPKPSAKPTAPGSPPPARENAAVAERKLQDGRVLNKQEADQKASAQDRAAEGLALTPTPAPPTLPAPAPAAPPAPVVAASAPKTENPDNAVKDLGLEQEKKRNVLVLETAKPATAAAPAATIAPPPPKSAEPKTPAEAVVAQNGATRFDAQKTGKGDAKPDVAVTGLPESKPAGLAVESNVKALKEEQLTAGIKADKAGEVAEAKRAPVADDARAPEAAPGAAIGGFAPSAVTEPDATILSIKTEDQTALLAKLEELVQRDGGSLSVVRSGGQRRQLALQGGSTGGGGTGGKPDDANFAQAEAPPAKKSVANQADGEVRDETKVAAKDEADKVVALKNIAPAESPAVTKSEPNAARIPEPLPVPAEPLAKSQLQASTVAQPRRVILRVPVSQKARVMEQLAQLKTEALRSKEKRATLAGNAADPTALERNREKERMPAADGGAVKEAQTNQLETGKAAAETEWTIITVLIEPIR